MKTAITFLSAIALLVAAPILAQGNGVVHSATGGGSIGIGDALRTFGFNAVQRSDGTATGQMQIQARQFGNTIHIEVNCLNVVGNVALISGTITQHTDPAEVGTTAGLAVEDNGDGPNAPATAPRSSSASHRGRPPACSSGLRTPRPSCCPSTAGTSRFANGKWG